MLSRQKIDRSITSLILLGFIIMSGCSDIRLQPKDPELINLGKFADQVTEHLLNMNPATYKNYQTALFDELSPTVLAQLRAHNQCAKSFSEIANVAKAAEKDGQRCVIQIESTSFPAQATSQGLVPIEVKGSCIKSQNYLSKASKFDVLYFVGTNVKTKRPIIASIEIKQF